tara:strand:- start:1221 stop:2186 length:966 start_codon:yes stop_codon:yes gene_type:complete
MPLPAPTPTVPNNTQWGVSGGTGYQSGVSGINLVSGATSALGNNDTSGPWCIESQWMTVTYHRVPKGLSRNSLTEADFTLSGFSPAVNTVSGYLYATELACHVEARAYKTKSYDPYTTSAYHQPQKFQVNPLSADANGNSYGNVSAGTFGPGGTVTTSQVFFNRRLWDDTVDAVYDDTCNAYSHYGVVSGAQEVSYPASGFGLYIQPVPSQSFAQKLSLFLGWDWNGFDELSPITVPYLCKLVVRNNGFASDPGAYTAQSDTVADVITTLNIIGMNVVTGQWLYHSDRFNVNTNWEGCLAWYPVDTSLLCTHYSINRHDYS